MPIDRLATHERAHTARAICRLLAEHGITFNTTDDADAVLALDVWDAYPRTADGTLAHGPAERGADWIPLRTVREARDFLGY